MASFKTDLAILLSAALLDMLFFGLVCQQFYSYWTGSFNDRIYMKLFVNVQFILVALQGAFIWRLVFQVFVDSFGVPPPPSSIWSGPANSLCQLFIIIFANIFLVTRIHGLTKCLVKCFAPMFFSTIAFVSGMVTIITAWATYPQSYKYSTSVVWYASQTVADCLISFFLVRALLKARSGMQRSDSVVMYLVRNVVQVAALATIWSIAALVSWFWLKQIVLYSVFGATSGTVYTHAIFESLISRTQLRDRMAASVTSAYVDLGYPNAQSQASRRSHVIVSNLSSAPRSHSNSEPGTTLTDNNDDAIELGKVAAGKPGIPFEL